MSTLKAVQSRQTAQSWDPPLEHTLLVMYDQGFIVINICAKTNMDLKARTSKASLGNIERKKGRKHGFIRRCEIYVSCLYDFLHDNFNLCHAVLLLSDQYGRVGSRERGFLSPVCSADSKIDLD
ncbi:hypothetical protein GWK47_036022 [Chionoecetes opilio]|uniref:Uncharacterized protein n=1 Tax=Chionoecetes opilio TaxID=41210 RepID=A0A8J4YET1_CHIOP|nr:hypothetical protein GWK47_036022 [Chionoecetes opilio]